MVDSMDKIVNLAKQRGFIFPGSEIYGGLQNSWDYGPLGTQLLNNLKSAWWKFFVESRPDMVGLDSTVIMNPLVWETSGHIDNFTDPLVEDKKTHIRYRADHLLEENGIDASGLSIDEMGKLIEDRKIKSPDGNDFTPPRQFNLMFKTFLGPTDPVSRIAEIYFKLETVDLLEISEEERKSKREKLKREAFEAFHEADSATAYLRPELAQGMFVDFPTVLRVSRKKLPFGIAQIGKTFRNEITAGNFIFRLKEFNLMEFEYFFNPKEWEKIFEMWLGEMKKWFEFIGIKEDSLYYHEIPDGERAHYSKRTIDIEYKFPFGTKELNAISYRTDFDLKNHMEKSGADFTYTDPETNEKFIPHVIEPTFGIDRTILAVLCSAYIEEEAPTADNGKTETRIVLKLPKALAPVKVAILPLSNKPELTDLATKIWDNLRPHFATEYDITQSIGRRYRRQDEIGTPYCVTVDFKSLSDNAVTVRDRDTMKQERVGIPGLADYLNDKLAL
ncbi:MAG: glycine--tRNA ligase [Candidatus Colwellbacteria bacterium]|nr:glycine--tRNA ligase [Candidatus Colwellbacteria bacterium]MBI3273723.1 glycine--tRNA ligase [Candidatus Colwellbacteria bacterium]